jgi:exosome complex RNA-binding protein Rrp4
VSLTSSTQKAFACPLRIYEPKENDHIIGVVVVRAPDLFLVDINSTEAGILPVTSFDHGRLPNRQAMNRLSVVYTRVARVESWLQPELSCLSTDPTKKKSNFGLIEQGNVLRCSLTLCEKLQRSPLINHLHRLVPHFQIRIARNGYVWYLTDTNQSMIAVKNVLYEHEFENNINSLIEHYQQWILKLHEQDDSFVKIKQQQQRQPTAKTDLENKPAVQSSRGKPTSTAVDRVLNNVIRDVLDKIIGQIELDEQS